MEIIRKDRPCVEDSGEGGDENGDEGPAKEETCSIFYPESCKIKEEKKTSRLCSNFPAILLKEGKDK